MQQSGKKSASPPTVRTKAKSSQKTSSGAGSASQKSKSTPTRRNKVASKSVSKQRSGSSGLVGPDLRQISSLIPYRQSFLKFSGQSNSSDSVNTGLLKSIRRNVKGLFDSSKSRGIDKEEFDRLRNAVGNLKSMKPDTSESHDDESDDSRPKTKRELLEEKRKALGSQQAKPQKKSTSVGMRIELERLKKKYPGDPNLTIMSAVLTAKDTATTSQSIENRLRSLDVALQEVGAVIMSDYLTTYSIDTFFDIYFLYLDALKSKLMGDLKTVTKEDSESLRRDIRVVDMLLEHKKLGKSIANIAKKLDGFGYPYEPIIAMHVSKTFRAEDSEGDNRIGPGTIKLNKFLIRLYLSVFSQIPILNPIARKYCDVLPSNRLSRALVANVNVENAIIKFKLAKFNRSMELQKMIMLVFNYAKSFIGTNFAETVNSPVEAKLLLRIAQMVEELALVNSSVPEEMIVYGYNCATIALHYHKEEAEALIRRISDIGARQRIELQK